MKQQQKQLTDVGGHARQGDVIIRRMADNSPVPPCQVKPTLAYGEVTGHHHSFSGGVTAYADDAQALADVVDVPTATPLEHQEHGPIPTPPGRYDKLVQVEDTSREVTRVAD